MKHLHRRLASTLAALYYVAALSVAFTLVFSANKVARTYAEIAVHQSASAKANRLLKDVLRTVTFGLYRSGEDAARGVAAAIRSAEHHQARATASAWALAGLSAAFLALLGFGHWRTHRVGPEVLASHLLGVSGVFLCVGLFAPILTVVARDEVAVLGEVVLQYESNGILSTVVKLFDTGNYFTAGLLFLFSGLIPVIKLLMSLAVLSPLPAEFRHRMLHVIVLIGRWSMTDVFVVAVLLAFLAAGSAQFTDASIGPGLYFFAGYGLLSIAASHLMLLHRDRLVGEHP